MTGFHPASWPANGADWMRGPAALAVTPAGQRGLGVLVLPAGKFRVAWSEPGGFEDPSVVLEVVAHSRI